MSEHVNDEARTFDFRDSSGTYTTSGQVATCRCGRRMLVYAVSYQPRALPDVHATCLECVELGDEFRRDLKITAEAIDRWIAEPPTEETR